MVDAEGPYRVKLNMNFAIHRYFTLPRNKARIDWKKLAEAGFYYNGSNKFSDRKLHCAFCQVVIELRYLNSNDDIDRICEEMHANCKDSPEFCQNVPIFDQPNYNYESHRYYSTLQKNDDWNFIDPLSMARSGFVYSGEADEVECHFCKLKIHEWEEGDKADTEHNKWNPHCSFLKGINVGNIKIGDEPISTYHDGTGNNTSSTRPFTVSVDLQFDGYDDTTTVSTEFATFQSRLDSFAEWPHQLPTPNALAEAGFVHCTDDGIGGRTICFHCGLEISDVSWNPEDLPLNVHGEFRRNCSFVDTVLTAREASHNA